MRICLKRQITSFQIISNWNELPEGTIFNTDIYIHVCVSVPQLCLTLCDPMDCNPPGSSVHGILQARILEWVAISFSKGSSWPGDWTQVSHIAGRLFTNWVIRKDLFHCMTMLYFVYLFVIDRHWSVTTFCLFWIMVLWTFVHKFCFRYNWHITLC